MSRPSLLGLLLGVALGAPALGADWHVAPRGVDGAAGSEAAPLSTLAHATSRAGASDRILLRRDGTYRAQKLDVGSGRQIDAYGTGADPILTASAAITLTGTWGQNSAVRTAALTERALAVHVDGRFVPLARYPNAGFLRIDNDNNPDRIVDAALASRPGVAAGRWTGAQVRWRRWSWWWETRPIVSHSAVDMLDLGPDGRFTDPFSDPGSGYFIDDDLDELDAPGEWYWGGGTLYLYPPDWANPDSMKVEVLTTEETGLITSGTSLRNIQFERFSTALEINRPTTVEDCTFEQIEVDAVRCNYDAQPFTIRGCVFRDVRNTAIQVWANPGGTAGTLIERNLFLRIGVERGYGGSGSWHAAGVIVGNAKSAQVRLNRFVDVGYAGIILGAAGQTVERNVFARTMGSLNDGAAIYTNCDASTLRENIILDTLGDLETSQPWWPLGHGIWLEFLGNYKDSMVADNTIFGSNGSGLFLPKNYHCTVTGNVAVDNRVAGFELEGDIGTNQDHTLQGNTLAAVVPTRRLQRPENLNQWWLPPYTPPTPVALGYQPDVDYGQMTDTSFIAPAAGASIIRPEDASDLNDLTAWTAAAPSWASSSGSRVVRGNAILLFNDTESDATMSVPVGTWTRPDGSAVGASIILAPFRSAVLVSTAAVAATPPYYSASGIDWRAQTPTNGVLTSTPEIAISRGAIALANGSTDSVTGTAAATAKSLSYTLANLGSVALTIATPAAISRQSNCAVTVATQPATSVAAGTTTTLTLTVTPTAGGPWSFDVSFGTNDADENPALFTVQGTAAGSPTPDLDISRGALLVADGATDVISGTTAGSAAPLNYVLANRGSGPLLVTVPAVVSAAVNCTPSVSTQPASSLAIDATSTLAVAVTPKAAGPWSFKLSVGSSDPDEDPYDWTASGIAAPQGSTPDAGRSDAAVLGDDAGTTPVGDAGRDGGVEADPFKSCGCTAGGGVLPAAALSLVTLRRRRR
jgi:hypothetical protein